MDASKDFVELLQDTVKGLGLDPALGAIYGEIYLEPGEISLEELSGKTGYSLASISGKAQALESIGYITRVRHPGTKKVFFRAEKDIIKLFREVFLKKQQFKIEMVKNRLPGIISECKKTARSLQDKERLKILENYYQQMLKAEKLMEKMREGLDSL